MEIVVTMLSQQKSLILVIASLILLLTTEPCHARSRRNQPKCNNEQQEKMTQEFQICLEKYTKEHHESSGKATTPEEYQVNFQNCAAAAENKYH